MKKLLFVALFTLIPTLGWGAPILSGSSKPAATADRPTPDRWQAYVQARVDRARQQATADAQTAYLKRMRLDRPSLLTDAPERPTPVVTEKLTVPPIAPPSGWLAPSSRALASTPPGS